MCRIRRAVGGWGRGKAFHLSVHVAALAHKVPCQENLILECGNALGGEVLGHVDVAVACRPVKRDPVKFVFRNNFMKFDTW
jgi:hypothetical protein